MSGGGREGGTGRRLTLAAFPVREELEQVELGDDARGAVLVHDQERGGAVGEQSERIVE